jgi:hypothetical protein
MSWRGYATDRRLGTALQLQASAALGHHPAQGPTATNTGQETSDTTPHGVSWRTGSSAACAAASRPAPYDENTDRQHRTALTSAAMQ